MANLAELLAQREALDREIELAKKRGRADAIAQVRSLMSEHGLTAADLGLAGKPAAKGGAGRKAAIKYRDAATGDTWSGRGLQPKWLKAAIASGRRLEDFSV
jgi:DNA-binding protein H-NS